MARRFRLRPLPSDEEQWWEESNPTIDRREFMRHSFNTAAGVITMASLGSIGFASLLMGLPIHPVEIQRSDLGPYRCRRFRLVR